MENSNRIQWQPLVEMIVVLVTILGSTIPLYLHTQDLIRSVQEDNKSFQAAMLNESKEFHGRLCIIEERNKTKEVTK